MKAYACHKNRLCLIGGGHSHGIVIEQLASKPVHGLQVILISPNTHTPYSGMLPGLIAGHYNYDDCHIDLHRLCQRAGVQYIRSTVTQINPELRKIYCIDHPPIEYDVLSINIGSQPAIAGIKRANMFGHTVKPVNNFLYHWHRWLTAHADMKQKQHIIVVGGGAAGIEVLLAMHYRLQNTTLTHAAFTLICADHTVLPSHNAKVRNFFLQHLQQLNITVIKNAHATSVDRRQIHLVDGSSLNYDFIVWAVHAGAQSWPKTSGLKCDSRGFIEVDQYLRSISHPNVFAAGDSAAFTPHPLPKAGVYAVREGPVLFKNFLATLKRQSLTPFQPQQHFLSLLTTGGRHAVASRGPLFLQGKWIWYWKNHIDQNFMRRFKL